MTCFEPLLKEQVGEYIHVASHWRDPHLLNIYCSGSGCDDLGLGSVFAGRSTGTNPKPNPIPPLSASLLTNRMWPLCTLSPTIKRE